jgi:hypothetical protein
MTRSIRFLSGPASLAAAAIIAATGLAIPHARAQICCSGPPPADVTDYAVLYLGDPHTLFWSDSSTNSNIGIGGGGNFVGSGSGTIDGQVRFAPPPAPPPSGPSLIYSPDGIDVTGGAVFGVATVATNLNALSTLSQSLRNEGGTGLLISAGGSIDASTRGIIDKNGNEVFTASINPNFTAGTTFTIDRASNQFVVINTTTGGLPLNGSIVLMGGITSDHVLFNLDAGNFDTMSGGDPLVIDTTDVSGIRHTTTGTFLDPNGALEISDSLIMGRIFGGDTADASISGSTITAPPLFGVPEPISVGLLGVGLVALGIVRRRHRALARS